MSEKKVTNKDGSDKRPRSVMTVLGPIDVSNVGIADAHNHVWIDAARGMPAGSPTLMDYNAILAELREYRNAGGNTILDCQPGGSGRNGVRLRNLARMSGVNIIACTGFHLRKYYPKDYWLWNATAEDCSDHFIKEIQKGIMESLGQTMPAKAGFIKAACETTLADTPQAPLEGAVHAAVQTGRMIAVHTDKGADVEKIITYFAENSVKLRQIVICHMDKRPDLRLHEALAGMGVLLVYDTFYRPQYRPDEVVYPLIEQMVANGHSRSIALATDMADPAMWKNIGGGVGLVGIITVIKRRLEDMGLGKEVVQQLMGGNIGARLAGLE